MKDYFALFKYRGDAEVIQAFEKQLKKLYRKEFKNTIAVPIPLSIERHYERGFNQSKFITDLVTKRQLDCLKRPVHETKQSKRSREDRLANETIFSFKTEYADQINGQNVTLVDDIYTTGSTVEAAGRILLDHGARTVSSMTVARG
ncbi:ComF family protein [Pseudalkalibacillus sp. SCS-8]|uniref:ComF family protein n=1 Tax=Pseudalkalibacillus nanhaiensis TaxID=3115291 RepID=UPI0032DBBF5C